MTPVFDAAALEEVAAIIEHQGAPALRDKACVIRQAILAYDELRRLHAAQALIGHPVSAPAVHDASDLARGLRDANVVQQLTEERDAPDGIQNAAITVVQLLRKMLDARTHEVRYDSLAANAEMIDVKPAPVDEVVGTGTYHVERLDTGLVWLQLGPDVFEIYARRAAALLFKHTERRA